MLSQNLYICQYNFNNCVCLILILFQTHTIVVHGTGVCYDLNQGHISKLQYAISQLRIVRSGLHLVTYLNVGNFCDKRTEKTLHEFCVQCFLRFSDSNRPSQSVSLIYELA